MYKLEAYLPVSLRTWVDDKLQSLRAYLISSGILADSSSSSSSSTVESKELSDARNTLSSAQSGLSDSQSKLKSDREDLERDYGPDAIFRVMKGTCVSLDSGEYTYEQCFMERTTQKPKKGGADTSMGSFVRFGTVQVDEDVPADGKGLGTGERMTLIYENGQHCWNGPSRSTTVVLGCAETDEIWKVMEEEKCVYRMDIGTPAVCEGLGAGISGEEKGTEKDEL